MHRGAWQATVHRVVKSRTQLSKKHFHFYQRNKTKQDFPGGPVVNTLSSPSRSLGSIHGWGTKIPQASGQKTKHKTAAVLLQIQ